MPIPVIDFSHYGTNSQTPPDLMASLQEGMQTAYMPRNLQAQLQLRQAQAQKESAQAKLPFGGASLPGIAGQLLGLESIKQMYGEQSPQYQTAKRGFDLQQQSTQSRIGYQDALTGTMPIRYLTPTGKGIIEQANVGQGNAPTGLPWDQQINPPRNEPLPLSPEQIERLKQFNGQYSPQQAPLQAPPQIQQGQEMPQQNQQMQPNGQGLQMQGSQLPANPLSPASSKELSDQYSLKRQKDTTDSATRARNLYATNIEKTLNNIDVDDLTRYSGLKGGLTYLKEKSNDALGKPVSPQYQKFKEALNASEFLASQARQFYGESIQPSMREKLEQLTNPSSWTSSPDTAKKVFKNTVKILGQEMKTYRDAMEGRDVYLGKENNQNQQKNFVDQQVIGGKTYFKDPNGDWHTT
jgi:hypothetical protein